MGSQDAKDLFWLLGGDQPADPSSLQASLIALGVALEPALHPPARNAKSRSEVLSGTPMTSEGRITLDPEPDVRETLLLADELDLDELVALRYIQAACERDGDVSASAAAGLFFAEREELLAALTFALSTAAAASISPDESPLPFLRGAAKSVLLDEINELLEPSRGILKALADGAEGSRLAAQPGAALLWLRDAGGRVADRVAMTARDRAACAEATALAATIAPAQDARTARALLAAAARGADGSAPARSVPSLQAALLTVLVPVPDADETSHASRVKLASDAGLGEDISRVSAEVPLLAPVALAWTALRSGAGPTSERMAVSAGLRTALRAGALSVLAMSLREEAVLDAPRATRDAVGRSAARTALAVVAGPSGDAFIDALSATSNARARGEISADLSTDAAADVTAAALAARGDLVDKTSTGGWGAQGSVDSTPSSGDSLGCLLSVLSGSLRVSPAIFVHDEWIREAIGALVGDRLGGSPMLASSPSTYVAYVRVLADLARSRTGASVVFEQLRTGNCYEAVSWRRAFDLLRTLSSRYDAAGSAKFSGGRTQPPGALPYATGATPMPPEAPLACDAAAATAYLSLLGNVLQNAPSSEASSRLSALADEGGGLETALSLALSPAPPELKAAAADVLRVSAALPRVARDLWTRLLEVLTEEVGNPASTPSGPSPHNVARPHSIARDVSYQLDHVAARSADYREQIAVIRAVNAAAREASRAGEAFASGGEDSSRATALGRFILEDVLGSITQRSFQSPAQRWDLAAACLVHGKIALESIARGTSVNGTVASVARIALEGVLGARGVLRGARAVLAVAPDELATARAQAAEDARARERAVRAALNLLSASLDAERTLAGSNGIQKVGPDGSHSHGVVAALRRDARELPRLLGWARYVPNPLVQAAALSLAVRLEAAEPDVASAIAAAPSERTDGPAPVALFADGLASALEAALAPRDGSEDAEGGDGGSSDTELEFDEDCVDDEDGDNPGIRGIDNDGLEATLVEHTDLETAFRPRGISRTGRVPREAVIALRLLVSGSTGSTWPSLAHVACAASPGTLAAALDLASDAALQISAPLASAAASRSVAALAARPESKHATLDAVAPRLSDLVTAMRAELPPRALRPASVRARLRSDASRVRLLAQILADSRGRPRESREALQALLAPPAGDSASPPLGSTLLRRSLRGVMPRPDLLADAGAATAEALRALGIDAWLAAAESGRAENRSVPPLVITARSGRPVLDLDTLRVRLLAGYRGWVSDRGLAEDAVRAACWAALRHAQRINAWSADAAARAALAEGWRSALLTGADAFVDKGLGIEQGGIIGTSLSEVALLDGSRWHSMERSTDRTPARSTSTRTAILELAFDSLREARGVLRGGSSDDAADIATEVAAALVTRAADIDETEGELSAGPPPALLHAVLEELLAASSVARARCRSSLAVALASYLDLCARLAPLRSARGTALDVVLSGAASAGAAAATAASEADAVAVAAGNAERAARAPLARMASAAGVSDVGASTLTLMALSELLGADTRGVVAAAMWEARLPARVLTSLREAEASNAHPTTDASRRLLARAQLALLARLLLAGAADARAASARGLLAAGALRALASCRLLDVGALGASAAFEGDEDARAARRAAYSVLAPALRIVVGLLTALPTADAAREGARVFLSSHDASLAAAIRFAAAATDPRGARRLDDPDTTSAIAAATLALRAFAWTFSEVDSTRDTPALADAALVAARMTFTCAQAEDEDGRRQHPQLHSTLAPWKNGNQGISTDAGAWEDSHLALQGSVAEYLAAATTAGGRAHTGRAHRAQLRLHPTRSTLEAPSLLAIKDELAKVVRGDLSTAASEIPAMLNAARLVGDDASSSDRLQAVMRAATGVSKSHRALFLAENLLAVLLVHLRAAPGAVSSNAITEESDSGESKDYDHLARLLGPVLRGLEQLLDAFNWVNVTPMSALLRPLLKLVEARH